MNRVEVIVASTNQTDHSLIKKMNIQTDVIVANQCDRNSVEEFYNNDNKCKYLNFNEKGVGLNRNNALMRATGEFCIIADDDMSFYEGYEKAVINLFDRLNKASVLIFNIDEDGVTTRRRNERIKKVHMYNYLNYGAARIVIKRNDILYHGISFNTRFGGGTNHSSGEDTLFLRDCLRRGLKIYAVPYSIARLNNNRESTWFKGYDNKYFKDVGIVLGLAHPFLCHLMVLCLAIMHKEYRNGANKNLFSIVKAFEKGIKYAKKREWNN